MNLAILDIIFGAILLIATVRCAIKGFVAEAMSLAALILGIGAAAIFFASGAQLLDNYFGASQWNQVIAFLLIFVIVYVLVKIFERGLKGLLERLHLGSLDRALGLFLGVFEGVVIIAVILIVLRIQPFFDVETLINEAIIAGIVLKIIPYGLTLIETRM